VLALALAATVPTTGDIGLTWDEPAYRFSQLRSAQWWGRLAGAVRAWDRDEVRALMEPDALLFYWTYARHGVNFHPPLAGQLNLLTHVVFGRWMKDIPSRRMASVLEYALAVALAFGFLGRRYGPWVGAVAAGSLLFMPRVYGDGHIAGTDTPGLLLWPATAVAFWKGLNEPRARRWRVAVGVLLGLAFVEKMAAVFVLAPLLLWLVATRRTWRFTRSDWLDGLLTPGAMLAPLGLALAEILRLTRYLPRPKVTNLFVEHPVTHLAGWVLAVPLGVWVVRRLLGRLFPRSPVWGAERPGLETWTAVLAFAPVVGWLGNPAWWRETLPRLAHYYLINTDRRGSLPDIQILYLGQTYEYSLPWHNAWVLIGVTVPAGILAAAVLGVLYALRVVRRDRLPLYFLLHFVTLPVFRMFPTPAHDGVRLFLPTFFFLAALAGWGAVWLADGLAGLFRARRAWVPRMVVSALVLVLPALLLGGVHPFELSYYNELIGGARGASRAGFELTYWYDAFNAETLREVNRRLPAGATVDFLNDKTNPMTFLELQSLGQLRPDIRLGVRDLSHFPYVWLLTQDSKASAFTRLLYAMKPWYSRNPVKLDRLRVATVADPAAVSRAWALALLTDAEDDRPPERPSAPDWVHRYAPFLGRLWGEGLTKVRRLNVYEPIFSWAQSDPEGLNAAARALAYHRGPDDDPAVRRLKAALDRYKSKSQLTALAWNLLPTRPEALVEAVAILTYNPDAVRRVLTRYQYTEPSSPFGFPYLDGPVEDTDDKTY
jgi:4-amino-4-deoxy-L-arabinose transferase-like glycosyltransferase